MGIIDVFYGNSGSEEPSFANAKTEDGTIIWSVFHREPTAHEAWVRDRIPRGSHYDPADDGPETDRKFQCLIAAVVKVVADVMMWKAFEEKWLDNHSFDFGGLDIDVWTHGRE